MTDRETIESAAACHGHMCPGLALGSRAAQVAVDAFGPRAGDEELVAVVETDMCGVDAIQVLVGCTFGKGNLVHRDHGKNVFTFFRRADGRAMRVSMRAAGWGRPTAWESLYAAIREGRAEDGQRQRFAALQRERSQAILSTPLDELYAVEEVEATLPPPSRILASVECAACGEPTMETRIRRLGGRGLCLPCFDHDLSGTTPVVFPRRSA